MTLQTRVVTTSDEFMQAAAIRAAVFIGEMGCPYAEEFDGNDFTASHILASLGDEPVGTMRLRWFGEFCMLERFAVLPRHRSYPVSAALARFSLEYAQRKGFKQAYAHAAEKVLPFWRRFGIAPMDGHDPVVIGGESYFPIQGALQGGAGIGMNDHEQLAGREADLLTPQQPIFTAAAE